MVYLLSIFYCTDLFLRFTLYFPQKRVNVSSLSHLEIVQVTLTLLFGFCAIHSGHVHLCVFIHSFSNWNSPAEKAWWMMTQPWHVLISLWADYASNLSTHNISHPTILHMHRATHFSRVYSPCTWLTNINNLEPDWVRREGSVIKVLHSMSAWSFELSVKIFQVILNYAAPYGPCYLDRYDKVHYNHAEH